MRQVWTMGQMADQPMFCVFFMTLMRHKGKDLFFGNAARFAHWRPDPEFLAFQRDNHIHQDQHADNIIEGRGVVSKAALNYKGGKTPGVHDLEMRVPPEVAKLMRENNMTVACAYCGKEGTRHRVS